MNKPKIKEINLKKTDFYLRFNQYSLSEKLTYFRMFEQNIKEQQYINTLSESEKSFFLSVVERINEFDLMMNKQGQEQYTTQYLDGPKQQDEEHNIMIEQQILQQSGISSDYVNSGIIAQPAMNQNESNQIQKLKTTQDIVQSIVIQKDDPTQIIQQKSLSKAQHMEVGPPPKLLQTQQNQKKEFQQQPCDRKSEFRGVDIILNSQQKIVMKLREFEIEVIDSNNQSKIKQTFQYSQSQQDPMRQSFLNFNYHFGTQEISALEGGNKMINSNVINGYINHLMIADEKLYFSLNKQDRQKYQRLFIIGSEFITDCALDQINLRQEELSQKKHLYIWLKYLEEFESIQYKFWLIYKRIGFVVNVSNVHWYFIEVKFEEKQIFIYDSMQQTLKGQYEKVISLLEYLFQQLTSEDSFKFHVVKSITFDQQKDGISCGYYTCIAANFLSQNPKQGMKTLPEMKQILKEILLSRSNADK